MIRPGSQNDRVLQVLADGLPHSASEIHRRAGFMRLNSRVAELRSKEGLTIVCEHIGGTGPEAFVYTLIDKFGEEGCGESDGGSRAHGSASVLSSPIQPPAAVLGATPSRAAGVQLSLEVAA